MQHSRSNDGHLYPATPPARDKVTIHGAIQVMPTLHPLCTAKEPAKSVSVDRRRPIVGGKLWALIDRCSDKWPTGAAEAAGRPPGRSCGSGNDPVRP
jgi:hypothetical protein